MIEILNDLGNKVTEVTEQLGKKTDKIMEVQRLKSEIRSKKKYNDMDYINIGKAVFEKYKNDEELDEATKKFCEEIETRNEEIETMIQVILDIKGMDCCPVCENHVEKNATFCSKCGQKLQDEPEFED